MATPGKRAKLTTQVRGGQQRTPSVFIPDTNAIESTSRRCGSAPARPRLPLRQRLVRAWADVKANKGAAGVGDVSIADIEARGVERARARISRFGANLPG